MSGLQPLERQWILLRTLAARRYGATVKELAHEFAVKTVRRDLALLRDLGLADDPHEEAHGRHRWVASCRTSPELTFDVSEVLALYLGRALLEPLAGTVVWDSTQSAFRKIKATLGEPALEYLSTLISWPASSTARRSATATFARRPSSSTT